MQYLITRKHDSDAGDPTGYKAMQRLLGLKPRPDGIFCYNDPTAMGAIRAALEADIDMPNNMAIMGCGNVAYAGFMRVPLTSGDRQSQKIGEASARLALDLLEKNPRRPKRVVLRPELVKPESTSRPENQRV
jgi:LacI family transcriptional regulator